jgi:hypothetical protein
VSDAPKSELPLERLIRAVSGAGLDVSVNGLLEALWLATLPDFQIFAAGPPAAPAEVPSPPPAPSSTGQPPLPPLPTPPAEPPAGLPPASPIPGKPVDKSAVFAAPGPSPTAGSMPASPLRIAASPALPHKLPLSRALRPLRKRYPSPNKFLLDEAATVDASADAGAFLPIFRRQREHWFEVAVVADDGASMDVWLDAWVEFEQLARASGAFRDFRRWRLSFRPNPDAAKPPAPLLTGVDGIPMDAAGLAQTNIRRLIFLLTNGVGPQWTDGRMHRLIRLWSGYCSVALVQLLPPHMWARTRIGEPTHSLRTLNAGAISAALDSESLWWDDDDDSDEPRKSPQRTSAAVPILPLDPAALSRWARMQMGGGQRVPAVVIRDLPQPATSTSQTRDIPRAVRSFTIHASDEANHLAVYLARGPFTLPVARLVQHVKFGARASHTQLAELLLSGFVERTTPVKDLVPADWVEYRCHPEAAEILRRGLREADANEIALALQSHIERHVGQPLDFKALIYDEAGRQSIPSWAQPFVRLGSKLMKLPDAAAPTPAGPVVFITWPAPADISVAQTLADALRNAELPVVLSGEIPVPSRGVMVIVTGRDTEPAFLNDDHYWACVSGLYVRRHHPEQPFGETLSAIHESFAHFASEPAKLHNVPPLDRERGRYHALGSLSGTSPLILFTNSAFDARRALADFVADAALRRTYTGGIYWLKPGDPIPTESPVFCVFESATSASVPTGHNFHAYLDPHPNVFWDLEDTAVYEGANYELAELPTPPLLAYQERLPRLLSFSPYLSQFTEQILQLPVRTGQRPLGLANDAALNSASAKRSHRAVIEAILRISYTSLHDHYQDCLGRYAVLRPDPPLELFAWATADLGYLLESPLGPDSSGQVHTALRLLASQDQGARKWHSEILAHAPESLAASLQIPYWRKNLVYHADRAGARQWADHTITSFQWWATRFALDGPRAMREDLASSPDMEKLLTRVESATSPEQLAQRIAADDFQIPDKLRSSAREWLAEAERTKVPAVLVAGDRALSIAPVTRWTAHALGRELAHRGWTLVAGTQRGVDHIVINAFVEEHRRRNTDHRPHLKLISFETDHHGLTIEGGFDVTIVPSTMDPLLAQSTAIILLAGNEWVQTIGQIAAERRIPVFPIAATGLAAEELFQQAVTQQRLPANHPASMKIQSTRQAQMVAALVLDSIQKPPASPPGPELPARLDNWKKFLDPASDKRSIFDWRSSTPALLPSQIEQLAKSPDPVHRILAYSSLRLHLATDVLPLVLAAAADDIETPNSPLTLVYMALGLFNRVFYSAELNVPEMPHNFNTVSLSRLRDRLRELPPSARRNDVESRIGKASRQIEIATASLQFMARVSGLPNSSNISEYERLAELPPAYPPLDEIRNHLRRPHSSRRYFAYAYLYAHPLPTLLEQLLTCIARYEEQPSGIYFGLQAAIAIIKSENSVNPDHRKEILRLLPKLPSGLAKEIEIRLSQTPQRKPSPQVNKGTRSATSLPKSKSKPPVTKSAAKKPRPSPRKK